MSPVKRYLLWAKPYWWAIGGVIVLGILQFVGPLSIPVITQILLDETLKGEGRWSLQHMVGFMALALSFGVVIKFVQGYVLAVLGNRMMKKLREDLYDHLQKMSVSFYDQRQVGAVTSRVIHDIGGAQNLIGGGVINLVLDLVLVLFAGTLLFYYNAFLAGLSLSILPFYYLTFTNMNVYIRLSWRAVHRQMERLSGRLVERVGGVRIVQAFTGELQESRRFREQTAQHYSHIVRSHLLSNVLGRLSETFANVGSILIWLVGGGMVLKGHMQVGEIVAFQGLLGSLYGPIQRFADVNVTIQNSITNIERIFEVFDEEPAVKEIEAPLSLPECRGDIRFENVTYTYVTRNLIYADRRMDPAADIIHRQPPPKRFFWVPTSVRPGNPKVSLESREGIRDVTFNAKKGEVIALVGPSGAGKSTLINLIPRFFDPTQGVVYIDGHDVRNYKLRDLRQHIALVLQDNILFSGTIRENIIYGKTDASEEEMIAAAEAANAHHFITEFDDGYDSIIGERGLRLSGGQRQRIGIARALLKNPQILILDEATSSLDAESEALVTEALERLMGGRTTFVIAHRLATVVRADQILVINEGRIQQRGTHRELLEEGGLYRELYETQLKAMRPEEFIEE